MRRLAFLSALLMIFAALYAGAEVNAKEARPQRMADPGLAAAKPSSSSEPAKPGEGQQHHPAPAAQSMPEDKTPAGPLLDKLGASLKEIETGLENQSLAGKTLEDLRQQIGPIEGSLAEVIDRLTPRLSEVKERLDQLGPKPGDGAPSESPEVTAERASQQKLYNETDEFLKRAHLLTVEADQTGAKITAQRRALFTRSLFEQTASIATPAIWRQVWQEAPRDLAVIRQASGQWFDALEQRLDGKHLAAFGGGASLIILLSFLLVRLARRVVARDSSAQDPGRLRKILAAWWIALVITLPAAAAVLLLDVILQYLDLGETHLQPFMQASAGAVLRTAAAAGIAIGLFAPSRRNWRLPKVPDKVAAGIFRLAVGLALIVSATRLIEALDEIAGASLPVAVAMHGVAALLGATLLGIELWRFGSAVEAEDCFGPQIGKGKDWFDFLRAASWFAAFIIAASVFSGYAAFGNFLTRQFFWAGAALCLLYMLAVLIDEATAAGFSPNSRFGRRLITIIGIHRNSLELMGVLVSGAARLALFGLAAILVLAPWGVQSSDISTDIRAALLGFKLGDTTISPASIFLAAAIFALALAALHAILNWTDSRLLPRTNLDAGLRNSIRTSLAYVGFVIAASLALGYLGLDFAKLALIAGALSVGIGFGLQSIVNNFVSGLILLWERTVRVGDWIVVGADQGFVRRINVRATEIETFDRAQVIIPNASLVAGVVTNLFRADRTGRIVIPLTVLASADPEKVREALVEVAKANSLVLSVPAPQVLFTGMSASALSFELRVFVSDVETLHRVKSDLHFAIFKRFKEEKFLDSPQPDATKIEIAGVERLGKVLEPAASRNGGAA